MGTTRTTGEPRTRGTDTTQQFAWVGIACAAVMLVVTAVLVARDASADSATTDSGAGAVLADDGAVADPSAVAADILPAAVTAMGSVTSVEFVLVRGGDPVYIDQFQSIALDGLIGQFNVPHEAQAVIDVEIDGSVRTQIGAVAIGDEIWMSNPVTGRFETLPAGYDIDPSRFFDPTGGWQPLLAGLTDVVLVGVENLGGERYHLRGVAASDDVTAVTAGLVRGQDVPIDVWIHPTTWLVTRAVLATSFESGDDISRSTWQLDLRRYGDSFSIDPP